MRESRAARLLLDAADGLNLRGLRVRAELPEVFVLPTVAVTLHDVLIPAVARVLVAHETIEEKQTDGEIDR